MRASHVSASSDLRLADTDCVNIRGLIVTTLVGVLAHEREIAQPLQIDLDLYVDLRDAGRSDDLADTANYGDVAERVAAIVREAKDILLERVAERIAETVVAIDRVDAVDVTVTKLRPPIPEQLESTGVRIRRTTADYSHKPRDPHLAFIALGSNLGDREEHLRYAVNAFPMVQAMSHVYETDPVGGPDDQSAYLNMVIAIHTFLDPYALLRQCRRTEAEALRQRTVRWGPRTLDVDVLFYDAVSITDPMLTIPHPRLAERRFVLAPLAELAPERCPPDWDAKLPPAGVHRRGPLFPE